MQPESTTLFFPNDFSFITTIMAPQTHIPTSANVLGTLGIVFWCIQLILQIWQNWRRKKTDGVPGVMMMIWAISMDNLPAPIKCSMLYLSTIFRLDSIRLLCSRSGTLRGRQYLARTMTQEAVQNFNLPLQIQPQIFGALSLTIWTQILVYSR